MAKNNNFKNIEVKPEDINFDSMIFYKGWVEVLKKFDDATFRECTENLFNYALNGIVPATFSNPMTEMFFNMAKPNIDANIKSRIASKMALESRWGNKQDGGKKGKDKEKPEKKDKSGNKEKREKQKEEKEEPHEEPQEEKPEEVTESEEAEETPQEAEETESEETEEEIDYTPEGYTPEEWQAFLKRQKEIISQPGFEKLMTEAKHTAECQWYFMEESHDLPKGYDKSQKFQWIQEQVDEELLAAGYFIE